MRRHAMAIILFAVAVGLLPIACTSEGGGSRTPSAENGQAIFEAQCSECHNTGRLTKVGPGLRNLMKREPHLTLPNKMPPNDVNLRLFLVQGGGEHPTFAQMAEADLDDLIAFLGTL